MQAATSQIDQILIVKLQAIDSYFAQCTQIVSDHILAKVQKHGENSQAIYESIKVSTARPPPSWLRRLPSHG